MNELRDRIINDIIDREIRPGPDGHYSNDPSDSGGETSWGVTAQVAWKHGYRGEMINMTRAQAFNILVAEFWDEISGDELVKLSERIAEEVADTGVNMGTSRAIRFLQRSLNAANNRGKNYLDLTVDGKAGTLTITALSHYLHTRSEEVMLKMLNSLQGAYYIELAERREKDEKYIYGWFMNRVVI